MLEPEALSDRSWPPPPPPLPPSTLPMAPVSGIRAASPPAIPIAVGDLGEQAGVDGEEDLGLAITEPQGLGADATAEEEEEEDSFQGAVRRFYLALVEVGAGDGDALGRLLQELAAMHAEIYVCADEQLKAINSEILADCERKAGQSLLDLLRKATSAMSPDPEAAYELFHECVRLKHEAKASNIYGGFLSRQLGEVASEALKALSPVRSIRRLQLGASADGEGVGQPHVTALAAVLGEASRVMALVGSYAGWAGQQQQPHDGTCGVSHETLVKMKKALNEIAVRDAQQVIEWYKEDADLRRYQERCLDRSSHLNIQDLDLVLEELKNLCGLCNRYIAFVGPELGQEVQALTIQVKELVSLYVCMESAYCTSSVVKALEVGRPIDIQEGVLISTIVEDVPEIVRTSIERAMETLDDFGTMAVANAAIELLSQDSVPSFYDALLQLLHERSLPTPRTPGAEDEDGARSGIDELSRALERALDEEEGDVPHQTMVYAVNSLDCAATSIAKMRDLLVRYRTGREGAGGVIDNVVDEVSRITKVYGAAFDALVGDFVDRYTSSGLLTYMGKVLQKVRYEIDGAAYEADMAGKDIFVTEFLDFMFVKDKVLRDCQTTMTERALVRFAEKVATKLSETLLEALRTKRFSEWGAMKLRNEIRILQARMADILDGQGTLLPQFAAVDNMVHLLNLESPADLNQYYRSGVALAEEEVKRILRQRVEFDPGQIDRLKLKQQPR